MFMTSSVNKHNRYAACRVQKNLLIRIEGDVTQSFIVTLIYMIMDILLQ